MSSNSEDQRYIDACKIVEIYERVSRLQNNKASVYINTDSNVAILEEILRAAEKSMEGMLKPSPDVSTQQQVQTLNNNGNMASINIEESSNSCDQNSQEEKNVPGFTPVVTIGQETIKTKSFKPYDKAIKAIVGSDLAAEKVKEDMERCFNCNLRAEFDFEIRPINFFAELLPLIDGMMDLIDDILEQLSPKDFVFDLCNLFDGLKWWCLADLINILLALQGLLTRYFGQLIKITLNWTFLIGPLLSFIVDLVSKFLEQLRRAIIAPLDCAAGALGVVSNLVDTTKETVDSLAAFKKVFPDFKPGSGSYRDKTRVKKELGVIDPSWKNPQFGVPGQNKARIINPKSKYDIPTSFEYTLNDTLESQFNKSKELRKRQRLFKEEERRLKRVQEKQEEYLKEKIADGYPSSMSNATEEQLRELQREMDRIDQMTKSDPLKQALFAINSAKQWINELFANLLLAVKSLNAWVLGTMALSVKLGGYILMILDLIKLVQVIIYMIETGTINICEEKRNNPEELKKKLDKILGFSIEDNRENIAEFKRQLYEFDEEEAAIGCKPSIGS